MASLLMVPLIGWFNAPAAGDVRPAPLAKVQIEKLITSTPKPDYEAEVLAPLHQAQAEKQKADEAAAALAEQQRQAELARAREVQLAQAAVTVAPSTGDCSGWISQAGITDVGNAYNLIMHESGCNPNSVNRSSGACGIGQQLPCGKWPHAWNDPVGGMIDMQAYVFGRYGSWANAWAHEVAVNWY